MSGLNLEILGSAGLYLNYSGNLLDTVQSLPACVTSPTTLKYCRFSAGVTGLVPGLQVTASVSGAILNIVDVVITVGTLAGGDAAGILFVEEVSGTLATAQNLVNVVTTYAVSRSAVLSLPKQSVYGAKSVFMLAETNTIIFLFDGTDPINSSGTPASWGIPIPAGASMPLHGWTNVKNLKFTNAAAASNGIFHLVLYYGGAE